jgi:hypothetical protein
VCASEADIPSETAGDLPYCHNYEAYNAKILVALVCAEGSSSERFAQTVTTAILNVNVNRDLKLQDQLKVNRDCPVACTATRGKGNRLRKSAINDVDIA